jgi:Tol biopolymer transport system component
MSVNGSLDVDLDRLLSDWLEADAAPRAPKSLETAFVEGVASTRQRPAWATTERWISMETRAQLGVMPRVAIVLLTIALLAIGAIGGYAIGSGLVDASDGSGGDPTAGLTYFTNEGAILTHPTDATGDPVLLTDDGEFATFPVWSPDGKRFAYVSAPTGWDGPFTIVIREADGSNPVVVSEPLEGGGAGVPYPLTWSPDGSTIVFAAERPDAGSVGDGRCPLEGSFCQRRIWSVPADGSELARIIGDPALAARFPLWTPDGESIIFAGSDDRAFDYGVYRMDADGANVERIGDLTGYGYSMYRLALSPDGTTLATAVGPDERDLYLVDLSTGEDTLIAGGEEDVSGPNWSPDGSLIAFSSFGREFTAESRPMLYDVASGEIISLDTTLEVLGWTPDGSSIVGFGPGRVPTAVDVTDPADPVATELEGVTDVLAPNWRPRP